MTDKLENSYYVYCHRCPLTFDILYVGMGRRERAYATKHNKASDIRYGNRTKEHSEYLDHLMSQGFLPHEWVIFIHTNLPKTEAYRLEKLEIDKLKPKFNRVAGIRSLKFNKNQLLEIKQARSLENLSYSALAKRFGCSPMVAHRIINDLSPRYKELLNA